MVWEGVVAGGIADGDGDLRVRKSSVTDKINLDRYTRALAPWRASVTRSGINALKPASQGPGFGARSGFMNLPVHPLAGQRVGYARISGASQNLDGQTD